MRKVLILLACALSVVLVACSGQAAQTSAKGSEQPTLTRKALNDYSWAELKEVSSKISAAGSDEEGREIAKQFGLVEEDGSLSTQTKQIVLNETRALDVRLAGIRHDERADGSGMAGLTFMTVGALDIRPMNDEDTIEGGWEASSLRGWLATEAPKMFEKDLMDSIVEVNKPANNSGIVLDAADLSVSVDKLWLFSAHEVCGDIAWDMDEYMQKRGTEDIDSVLNAEGRQYEVFSQAGVTYNSGANPFLSLENSTGASPWWYRTPYPFDWVGYETGVNGFFLRVSNVGNPESLGTPQDRSSVVVGFCV